MKKLILSKLTIDNFKKIEHLEVDFKEQTTIIGKNGVGKTTIFDAFSWLLFGKDSFGATKFDIKFIDEFGIATHNKENSVSGVINGILIKRVLREKWVKKRGDETETFEGNETVYEYDGVVCNQSDFNKYIAELIDESIFKLLTSITYFNSLKWEERRKILYSLVPFISDLDIAGDNQDFLKLVNYLNGKSLDLFRSELKAKIAPLKKELDQLNAEIKGTKKNIASDIDINALIKERDSLGNPNSINEEILQKRVEIENEISKQKEKRNKEIQDKLFEKRIQEREIDSKKAQILELQSVVDSCNAKREGLIVQWESESSKQFSHSECPSCGINIVEVLTHLNKDSEIYEKLASKDTHSIEEFNTLKSKALENINKLGENNNIIKNDALLQIETIEKWLSEVLVITVDQTPFDDSELRKTIPELKPCDETIVQKIAEINEKIGFQKATDEQNQKLQDSIKKSKVLAEKLASFENTQFQCEKFARVKSDIFVEKINKMFSYVKFKLFETQINGGEVECCETLVNGISYSSNLNTGAKINAGIDIVNVLSKYHDIYCPVFIDNMESCTSPIEVESQSILLIADKSVETLTIK